MANDDDWTTISRKKGKGGARYSHTKPPAVNGLDPSITATDLQLAFQKKLKVWQASSCRRSLLQILRRNAPDDGWKFDKAVCLATGSFSTGNAELNRRSLMQFACFLDLAREIAGEVEMLAQEPRYADIDKKLLQGLGVRVLDIELSSDSGLGPVKQHLGLRTLVCDFFLNMNPEATREFFAVDHGLYLGTPFEQSFIQSDDELRMGRGRFEEGYEKRKMPWFGEEPGVFEGLMVYWPCLREEEDQEPSG